MRTKVKALQAFVHGRQLAEEGGEYTFSKGDAEELAKAGLVEIVADQEQSTADVKMDQAPVENKMADAPENKSRKSKQSEA